MTTREATIMTVGLGFIFVIMILPLPIIFLEKVILGLLLSLCSFRGTLKVIIIASIVRGLFFAMQYGGLFGLLIWVPTDIVITIMILPFCWYIFKKLKVRERVGI